MLLAYDPTRRVLVPITELPAAGWVHASAPTEAELALLAKRGLPAALLDHGLDPWEIARMSRQDAATLYVLRVPVHQSEARALPYVSTALGIVAFERLIVTLSRDESGAFEDIVSMGEVDAERPIRFVAEVAIRAADRFLTHVRAIDEVVNELEGGLKASLANREVLELLRYQKGLVHFTTALTSDEIMMERLARDPQCHLTDADRDRVDEALVELRQANHMATVSSDILSQMMDAFASIISNNLNVVMKVLTALTVILTGPILVASLYGMNVKLPGAGHPLAFVAILLGSILLSGLVALVLHRRRWF